MDDFSTCYRKKLVSARDKELERLRLETMHEDCIVYLKIVHFNTFKKLFEILASACGNIAFVFNSDRILMNTMNETQSFVLHLELFAKEKMTYRFNQQCIMYINARELYNDVFKIKDKKSICYLYVKKAQPENFYVTYLSCEGGVASTFELVSREEDVPKYTFPTFQFTLSVTLKSQLFHRLVSERKKPDNFELIVKNRSIVLNSDGILTSKRYDVIYEPMVIFPKLSAEMIEKLKKPVSIGEFAVRKINLFYKLPAISEHVTLHMNTDDPGEPLACEYKLAGELGVLWVFFSKNN